MIIFDPFPLLGDLDGIASANWGLAQIDLARQDYESAVPRLIEAFQALLKLQRPDGLAVVGHALGQILLAFDLLEEARTVLETSLTAAVKIGSAQMVEQISALLNRAGDRSESISPKSPSTDQ